MVTIGISTYTQFGGIYPETAALANILATRGLGTPDGKPYTEAMLLGISGGLGVGYILWEFQDHQAKVLVLGFHNRWQYTIQYYQGLCERLGLAYTMPETGRRKTALQILLDALNHNIPALAWVDRASMPYLQLPESMRGHIGHIVSVCGMEGAGPDATFLVDDLARRPFRVTADALTEARARITSYKNRLLLVGNPIGRLDLKAAINTGLQDCIDHLSSHSESFSLPALRKWAKTMTDAKNKKGWPKVFQDRRGLFSTLASLYDSIRLNGAAGGLRGMYGDFLDEAAQILDKPKLSDAANKYRVLGAEYDRLAEEALPDEVAPFQQAKQLLATRHEAFLKGGDAWRETRTITDELRALRTTCNVEFPLDSDATHGLFAALQSRLNAIYQGELQALDALRTAYSLETLS
jgi:hypothetical protein